VLIPI